MECTFLALLPLLPTSRDYPAPSSKNAKSSFLLLDYTRDCLLSKIPLNSRSLIDDICFLSIRKTGSKSLFSKTQKETHCLITPQSKTTNFNQKTELLFSIDSLVKPFAPNPANVWVPQMSSLF